MRRSTSRCFFGFGRGGGGSGGGGGQQGNGFFQNAGSCSRGNCSPGASSSASGGFPGGFSKVFGSGGGGGSGAGSGFPGFFAGANPGNGGAGGGFPNIFGSGGGGSGVGGNPASGGGGFPNVFGGGGGGNNPFGSMFDKALEWCSVSHAHDIAKRNGIDLRDIKFETLPDGSIKVMVDAPTATQQQVQQLGEQVMQECPLARFRKSQAKENPQKQMQWLRLPDKYDR